METVDDRTFKQKVHDFKVRLVEKWDQFITWCKENPETALGALIFALPIIGKVLTSIFRFLRTVFEDYADKTDFYDPRTGEHWYTRRPLTSREKLNLERRYNNGESKGKILHEMHLL